MAKITFDELVAKKLQKEQSALETKEIDVGDGKTLTASKCSDSIILKLLNEIDKDAALETAAESYKKLIYHSFEDLRNTELHKELGITDPYDVVSALFSAVEILNIGNKLMDFVGFDVGEKIKN